MIGGTGVTPNFERERKSTFGKSLSALNFMPQFDSGRDARNSRPEACSTNKTGGPFPVRLRNEFLHQLFL